MVVERRRRVSRSGRMYLENARRVGGTGAKRDRLVRRVKREEDRCHLCGGAVDTRLPGRLPGSPEVDELVPVSLGGSPWDRDNVRLAHRYCNARRSNGPYGPWRAALHAHPPLFGPDGSLARAGADDALSPRLRNRVTSRAWM